MKTARICWIGPYLLLTACTTPPPASQRPPAQTAAPTSYPILAPSSTASPSPTASAIAAHTNSPATTPTRQPPLPPLATASVINFAGWSLDSRWVAYWTYTWEEIDAMPDHGGPFDYPPGVLHFTELASGASCEYSYPASLLYSRPVFAWQEDGRAAVLADDGIVRVGAPCAAETETLTGLAALIALRDPSLSPDQAHQVEIVEQGFDEETGAIRVAIIITETATGQERNRVEADVTRYLGEVYYGEWVSEAWYLVYKTHDFGPLLLTTTGETIQVLPEFFPGVNCDFAVCIRTMRGYFAPGLDGYFHLLLARDEFGMFLYHSETGEVEVLPFDFAYWNPLSPRGEWVLMLEDLTEDAPLWARMVDPVGSELIGLGGHIWLMSWSPDEARIAFNTERGGVRVETFPEGETLGSWDFGPADWSAWSLDWSPDGSSLAVMISWFDREQEAELYILENLGEGVEPAPGATP